ncbi:FecR domain-containing protein [Aliarcobacter butzleri]|uniref:FecR domain-containing protein n=1 Tax=Aliarcobacter butzleri TaxID=28197 RepID=UPI003AFA9FCE
MIQDILMPDNSKITLDAKTNIKVAYSKNKREVFLEKGKALFEVSPNKQKPFFVKSDDIFVKVVGTKFE